MTGVNAWLFLSCFSRSFLSIKLAHFIFEIILMGVSLVPVRAVNAFYWTPAQKITFKVFNKTVFIVINFG